MSHWIACFQDVTASSSWSVLTVLNCGQIISFYFEHLRQKQLRLKRFCTYQPTQTTLFISSRSSLKCRPNKDYSSLLTTKTRIKWCWFFLFLNIDLTRIVQPFCNKYYRKISTNKKQFAFRTVMFAFILSSITSLAVESCSIHWLNRCKKFWN